MFVKLITVLIAAAGMILQAKSAAIRNQDANVAAVFVKDSNTGQLRFLGNRFGNAQLSQLITNKQDFLERFRPAGNWDNGVDVITQTNSDGPTTQTLTDTNTDTITNGGTGVTSTGNEATDIGTATGASGAAGTRVRPIVIQANRVNANRRGKPNRRRGNRRRGNRRRPANSRPKIIIIHQRQ